MATKRQRKEHLGAAVGWALVIAGFDVMNEGEMEEVQAFIRKGRSFFKRRRSKVIGFVYLRISQGVELAFSSVSLGILIMRFDYNFSEAGKVFRPWHEAWKRDVPSHIRRSFEFSSTAVSREIYEITEV